MTKHAYVCADPAPPIDPGIHRRIAMRRLGLRGAVAPAVADLAFGEPRDSIVVIAVADAGILAEGVRR